MRWSEDFVEIDDGSSGDLELLPLPQEQVVKGESGGKQSRLISKVLAPALKLWVRSQLNHVEDLHLDIQAGDRQLLSGGVQRVSASARKGIYQGLHLSQISLVGQQIQTNLGQVLRGKPIRLLAPFPIAGTVALSEADLNASLTAPLLANAVTDFLLSFLFREDGQSGHLSQEATRFEQVQVQFGQEKLAFTAILVIAERKTYPVEIHTGLRIQDGNQLVLEQFQCQVNSAEGDVLPSNLPDHWVFDLGSEVFLEELRVLPDQIRCSGRITVQP